MFALVAGELLVNTTTAQRQYDSAISAAPDGRYVSVWTHQYSSTDTDIYAQRFNASGAKVGSEIRVATTSRKEFAPDVAMDSNGNFVVTWVDQVSSNNQDIKAQRFSSTGTKQGSAIAVAASAKNESNPSIAVDANGNFVVAWQLAFSSSDSDIRARRYFASGTPIASEFVVANSTWNETYPDVARSPDGRFAISYAIASSNGDVMLKRYSATGSLVNTHSIATGDNRQSNPRISMDNSANTMVVWDEQVGNDRDIKARRVSNTGSRGAIITVVNTLSDEFAPDVAFKRDGSAFVVTHYNLNTFSAAITELTVSGTVRYRSTIASSAVVETPPIVFGAGSRYELLYGKNSTIAGRSWDIYRRRGILS